MEPVTRKEMYLAKAGGVYDGDIPDPVTREEYYLAAVCGAYTGTLPEPVTRLEQFMAYAAGAWDGTLPEPITRRECYWAVICGVSEQDTPTPITREEWYLAQVAVAYGYIDADAAGVNITLSDSAKKELDSLKIYGWSTQDNDTPTPDNPSDIISAADSGAINVTLSDGGDNAQTITLAAENGLLGIPVSSGGNYTDDNGQQWVADEIVLNKDGTGVYRAWVWSRVFDGSENWAVYNIYEEYTGFFLSNSIPDSSLRREGLCSEFPVHTSPVSYTASMWLGVYNRNIFMASNPYYDTDAEDYGLAAWKDHLAESPMTVMTYLDEPEETELTADEVSAFLALKTYSGTTIITNDADAYMEVEYKAKTE